MATYAIGDVQGCYTELQSLLKKCQFDPKHDVLWFCGDLVNRGPDSLSVLRFIKELGESAITVLGNHDLHLLALHAGVTHTSPSDTLDDVLNAPDCDELCDWLRQQKILHHDTDLKLTLVHAGLIPHWSIDDALNYAHELEMCLRGPDTLNFLKHMYGNQPDRWSNDLAGWSRLRFICNVFTRLRYCTPDGQLDLTHKGPLGSQPDTLIPWFAIPERASREDTIIFGHWASLLGQTQQAKAICLDTGCIWGHALTALRLEDKQFYTSSPSE